MDKAFELFMQGLSYRAIAAELGVSKSTVERWINTRPVPEKDNRENEVMRDNEMKGTAGQKRQRPDTDKQDKRTEQDNNHFGTKGTVVYNVKKERIMNSFPEKRDEQDLRDNDLNGTEASGHGDNEDALDNWNKEETGQWDSHRTNKDSTEEIQEITEWDNDERDTIRTIELSEANGTQENNCKKDVVKTPEETISRFLDELDFKLDRLRDKEDAEKMRNVKEPYHRDNDPSGKEMKAELSPVRKSSSVPQRKDNGTEGQKDKPVLKRREPVTITNHLGQKVCDGMEIYLNEEDLEEARKPVSYMDRERMEKASEHLKRWIMKILRLSQKQKFPAEILQELYKEMKEYQQSFDYSQLHKSYKYRIFIEKITAKIKECVLNLKISKAPYTQIGIDEGPEKEMKDILLQLS